MKTISKDFFHYNFMRVLSFKSVLILVLLFLVVFSQRGGGSRSRSSSRSSSSRRSSSSSSGWGSRRRYRSRGSSNFSWWPFSSDDTNETQTNSTNDEQDQEYSSGGLGWGWIGVIVSVIGGLAYFGNESQKKKSAQRKDRLERLYTEFEGNCQSNPCTLSPQQMTASKDWFMENKWKILFKTASGSFKDTAQVTLKSIEEKSSQSYRFKMSMLDSIGGSQASGILVHQADYLSIMFEKIYDNRAQAGQTGTFDLLLYEGVQQGQSFRGSWRYQGYENNSEYSGTWQMIHQ